MLKEINIENAAIEWLQKQGYGYQHGSEMERDLKQVVLADRLLDFLEKRYNHLPQKVLAEVLWEFVSNKGMDLHYRNREFHRKLSKGIDISWKDTNGNEKAEHVYPIDYENPENNDFLCVNQFPVEGKNKRIPDLVVFVNGLPLVVFEFKNWFDENATEKEAFKIGRAHV